ncbi:MAG: tetraacyldisaccharide 4'-kinase [Armatimonadota bacterium]|nr:MAG: tetraacyldisaccharide 4'-kinase [Armatimonadota bacterium]
MAVQHPVSKPSPTILTWPAPAPEALPAFDWRLLLYNLAQLLFAPLLGLYVLWRIVVRGKLRAGWRERLGFVPAAGRHRPGGPHIWLHAVSVGEVAAASCLLDTIKRRMPAARVVLTTTTATGREMAERTCRGADAVFFFPFDLMPAVERAFDAMRPDLCLLTESELWPNFLSSARRRGVPTMVVNGRVSDRTLRRLRLLRPFFPWIVRRVDRFCMQSDGDVRRIVHFGADPRRTANLGNVKFDQIIARVPADGRAELARELGVAGAETVVLAASTHAGEERTALDAFHTVRQVDPAARLIIAPRHIERAAEIEQAVAQAGLRSRRRTDGPSASAEGPNTVVILDTIGELERVYAVATVAFVGGSFAPIGGHNVLQAAAQGVPSVFGPHMHNFRDIAAIFLDTGLGFQVQRPDELGPKLAWLLEERSRVRAIADRCAEVLARHRGAADRCVTAAGEMLSYRPPGVEATPTRQFHAFALGALSGADGSNGARLLVALLTPASVLYWLGLKVNRLMYRIGLARVTRLPARVISIGNLTTGGTGKTSAAAVLAAAAVESGSRPAILSRGYGRRDRQRTAVVSNGARLLANHVTAGDEPCLLARKVAGAAVLVGKDRRETGRKAVDAFGADVLILDDGFQYWRLAKDYEIVLVDALAPFGSGLLLPAGILREPVDHIRRADAVWISHADLAGANRVAAIRARLSRFFDGRIIETVHRPVELRSLDGGETLEPAELRGKLVAALSGIGNPLGFELTLERLGAHALPVRFPDHHRFTPEDCAKVEQFARRRGAVIVTTEKDAVRLDVDAFSTPVWMLEVALVAAKAGVALTSAVER